MQFSIILMLALVVSFTSVLDGQSHCDGPVALTNTSDVDLTVNPENVQINITANVTLTCNVFSEALKGFDEISRIRIVKQNETDGSWDWVVEIRNDGNVKVANTSFHTPITNVSGEVNESTPHAQAQFTWQNVTNEIFGYYRCDIVGFDGCLRVLQLESNKSLIELHEVRPDEVFSLLLQDQAEIFSRLGALENEVHHLTQSFTDFMNKTEVRLHALEQPASSSSGK